MPEIYLPLVMNNAQTRKIVIDPLTRIEGHLRIEAQVENGVVTDAWSSSTSFRGIETILKGRDPRDAWVFTQRVCGVCTTVHAICSVRAVENALGITVPENAHILRNLIEAVQFVQDHVIHFYHLHALDWVDFVNALSANPTATSNLAKSISDWPNSSASYFQGVKERLQTFVASGQLGIFGNAYWGHPAYKLPPEANLLAVAHYLEALTLQREAVRMHAILGGKNPHPQTYLVGGMATPLHPDNQHAINLQSITQLKSLAAQALDFVARVYIPDLLLVASHYKDWATRGEGVGNYLVYGDFPMGDSNDPSELWLPRGIILNKDIASPPLPLDQNQVKEYVARSWYTYAGDAAAARHPWEGETRPNYTGPQPPYDLLETDAKYSWLKAPRYNDMVMEVGPLARMLVAYAAGHARVREAINDVLATLGVGPQALFSTLGRVAARGVETLLVAEKMEPWLDKLEANIRSGNLTIHNNTLWDPASWPAEAVGWGATEAPRGALGHWVRIQNGQIENYQMVVSTTWNGSPRDALGQRGAWEEALVGTPVADPENPVEILRTVHSFDPCMACSVHVLDGRAHEITQVRVM